MNVAFRIKRLGIGTIKTVARITLKVGVGVVGYLAFDNHVATLRRIEGPSMSPTINAREYLESKFDDLEEFNPTREINPNPDFILFWRKFQLERGDIVLVVDPKNPNLYITKRVLGLAGDTIVPLGFNASRKEPITVPENKVWVESDAGYGYKDSNQFGPVDITDVQGKADYCFNVLNLNIRSLWSTPIPENQASRLTVNTQ